MRDASHIVLGGELRNKPAPIGHNGGPPLDVGWNAWNWRRAHAKAWKTPGREIVILRSRRAEALGLSYRAYTSVLLDRGARLAGIVVMCGDTLLVHEEKVATKLAMLKECSLLLCNGNGRFEDVKELTRVDRDELPTAVKELAAAAGTSPGAFFMVGAEEADQHLARTLGLGLFLDAADYFGFAKRGA